VSDVAVIVALAAPDAGFPVVQKVGDVPIVPPVVACFAVSVSVTPLGMLANVSLMFEPFAVGEVLFEL